MASKEHKPLRLESVDVLSDVDRRWNSRAAELELDALSAVRSSAEKWAAGLTGLLGVVGLAALLNGADKFAKLSPTWSAVGKLAFFAAAVLAAAATVAALLATQVTSKRLFMPTPSAVKRLSEEAVNSALTKLAVSRWAAAGAVAVLLIAAACIWWAPSKKAKPDITSVRVSGIICRGRVAKPLARVQSSGRTVLITCTR